MDKATDLLLALPRFADQGAGAYSPGLERVRALLAAMHDPHAGMPAIHVGGTNGKGSTASLAAAVATAAGKRVGLHTSPHLLDVRERMRIGGVPVGGGWLDSAVKQHADAIEEIGPSFFEATVALSLLAFREHDVDLAIVEVGLGGRLDATNVLQSTVAAVTHIGLDHTDLLGETLPEIAREKAGIAKAGGVFLHAVDVPDAREALEEEAAGRGASVEDVRRSCRVSHVESHGGGITFRLTTPHLAYGRVSVPLPGAFQAWNATLAVRAAEERLGNVSKAAVLRGLNEVQGLSGLRGRGGRVGRMTLDVAHNEAGWQTAIENARPPQGGRLYVLCNAMLDKHPERLGRLLKSVDAVAIPVGLDSARALPREDWIAILGKWGVETLDLDDVPNALSWFHRETCRLDRLLATGSHLVVAAVLREIEHAGRDTTLTRKQE